ncbi:hypothetical protein RhiirC2_783781 [Rhizophagus irregularis]|uniref:Uncharacterized protein n=1 Tax=Rhizophagus irregularis TaxID=588596 RepID=A0A2N1N026_9GLOM|nr:hypothetical protein RhiirC2_783781 [Rhizophagus irregularis]
MKTAVNIQYVSALTLRFERSVSALTIHSGVWIASTFRFGSPTRTFSYAAARQDFHTRITYAICEELLKQKKD